MHVHILTKIVDKMQVNGPHTWGHKWVHMFMYNYGKWAEQGGESYGHVYMY